MNEISRKQITLPTGHRLDFEIGQIVYLKTDPNQSERMITAITIRPLGHVAYCLAFGPDESWHQAIEIDDKMDYLKTMN